jgi:ComF family protein
MKLEELIVSFIKLIFPDLCVVCGGRLIDHNKFLCLSCLENLPKTGYHLRRENRAKCCFEGKIPIERASSYLYYSKGGITQSIVREIKYHKNLKLGKWIGEVIAKEIAPSGFFDGIDIMLPVPLHRSKERKRGYNQSTVIAQGIQSVTAIPIDTGSIIRTKANPTQTTKTFFERWQNTHGIFELVDAERLKNRHILLIDDVLTSGSTLEAVARAAIMAEGTKISVLTIATVC